MKRNMTIAEATAYLNGGKRFTEFFPLRLPGGPELSGLSVSCSTCGEILGAESMVGEISKGMGGVFNFEGFAHCCGCNCLTRFGGRVRTENENTVRYDYESPTGAWETSYGEFVEPTILERALEASGNAWKWLAEVDSFSEVAMVFGKLPAWCLYPVVFALSIYLFGVAIYW